jgi:hypothetical protein
MGIGDVVMAAVRQHVDSPSLAPRLHVPKGAPTLLHSTRPGGSVHCSCQSLYKHLGSTLVLKLGTVLILAPTPFLILCMCEAPHLTDLQSHVHCSAWMVRMFAKIARAMHLT